MRKFKRNEVLLLLGAGASVDAGIPHAQDMVHSIETLVNGEPPADDWVQYRGLFHYLRSSVFYAQGIQGIAAHQVSFNIETLVNTLEELTKKETHPLYPFVGAWNPKLVDVAGPAFEKAGQFRARILKQLREKWLALRSYEDQAGYFRKLLEFQAEYQFPLRVFTLNYDLCVEKVCGFDNVQRGFENRIWNWRLFDDTAEDERKPLFLYKLHGSMDWVKEEDQLTYHDDPSRIPPEQVDIIFGTTYKLQYVDPFLFFAYELRRWTLDPDARLIVAVGYGFGDEHINGILGQALRHSPERRLLVVGPEAAMEGHIDEVVRKLGARPGQVLPETSRAKEFLEHRLTMGSLAELFPEEPTVVPELPSAADGDPADSESMPVEAELRPAASTTE